MFRSCAFRSVASICLSMFVTATSASLSAESIPRVPYDLTAKHAPGFHFIGGGGRYPHGDCLHSCLTFRLDHYGWFPSKGFGVTLPPTSHQDERHIKTQALIAYLEDDATIDKTYNLASRGTVSRWDEPPVVRVMESASDLMAWDTMRAIQRINSALPNDWRIDFDPTPYPGLGQEPFRPNDGEIVIAFTKPSDRYGDPSGGQAKWWPAAGDPISAGYINVDPTYWTQYANVMVPNTSYGFNTGRNVGLATLIHELIHTLGRDHARQAAVMFKTIMREKFHPDFYYNSERAFWLLDMDALLAVYGWLDLGDRVEDVAGKLSGWQTEHPYMFNALTYKGLDEVHLDSSVSFGVVWNNGAAQPWVRGGGTLRFGKPTEIAIDTFLEGSEVDGLLTWRGELMGFTLDMRVVLGEARLDVDPRTLGAELKISNLRSWAWGVDPRDTDGDIWGDGDLFYTIGIRPDVNAFVEYEGDTGLVTGLLYDAHDGFGYLQGFGGVLEHENLVAAFGGICDAQSGFRSLLKVQNRQGMNVCHDFGIQEDNTKLVATERQVVESQEVQQVLQDQLAAYEAAYLELHQEIKEYMNRLASCEAWHLETEEQAAMAWAEAEKAAAAGLWGSCTISRASFGGNGGRPFVSAAPWQLSIWTGAWVDGIILNGQLHGRRGGWNEQTLKLQPGEYINRMVIGAGPLVDRLEFYTNYSQVISGGTSGQGGIPETFDNIRVLMIGGRSGAYLDRIEVLYCADYQP